MVKPTVSNIAKKYRKSIVKNKCYEISFHAFPQTLFWPPNFSVDRLDQVIAESFDESDWHYYQKEHTKVEDGEILLDIGTAEGLFPLMVVDKCSHIYMIEPSTSFYGCLQNTFEAYSDKVTIWNTAVGNEDGLISFDENELEGMISADSSINKIAIARIDSLFKPEQRITYLKADIEGFELEMLKGAENVIKMHKPKIAITTYHIPNNPDEIISLIKSYVPEYKYYVKGIYEKTPKPILIHFWI
jgi:FkbM family methyltransferase